MVEFVKVVVLVIEEILCFFIGELWIFDGVYGFVDGNIFC